MSKYNNSKSNDNALVSIIMNCYNGEKYLSESIDSIYAQTYQNWEIIFWDNASTDRSANIAKSYDERIKYHLNSETVPLGEARNCAFKKTSGEYIAFLDCDDVYFPDKLEQQVKLMQSKDYVMCYGSVAVIDEKGEEIRKDIVENKSGDVFPGLLRRYEVNMQTVMLKRDFIVDNQLSFNTNMSYCPDHNLFMTIASKVKVGVITDIVAKYRIVSNSLSKETINIAPQEYCLTLDEISKSNPVLRQQLSNDFDCAYNKAKYYEVVADIYNNNKKQARYNLRTILTSKIEYFLLYLLLLMPISNKIILKLLGR
jgi:glycosyltransferase involved in cell wall biosynthesis